MQLRGVLLMFGFYIAANVIIMHFTVDGAALKYGADVSSWYQPALGLLKYGGFVDPNEPSKFLVLRPPLYPAFIALLLRLSGEVIWSIVAVQVALLFATGLVARRISERMLPGYGMLVMALVVFNPNAIGTAHLVQSDTLYAFVFILLFLCLLVFCRQLSWTTALTTGAVLGISLLARNPLQALMPLWPLVMMVLAMIAHGPTVWKRALIMGIAATALGYAITTPWLFYTYRAGEGFGQTTDVQKNWYLRIQLVYLEHCRTGLSNDQVAALARQKRELRLNQISNLAHMSEEKQTRLLIDDSLNQMRSYSVRDYICALVPSWALMYGSPGVSNFSQLFGLVQQDVLSLLRWNRYADYFSKVSLISLALTLSGFVYLITIRILDLIGLIVMIRRRAWVPLTMMLGAMTYLTAIMLFSGTSRFRLPLEPMLFIMAAYGVAGIRAKWLARSATAGTSKTSKAVALD